MLPARWRPVLLAAFLGTTGLALAGCPPAPCCQTDADCPDPGHLCVEQTCSFACLDDSECAPDELCLRQDGLSSQLGACVRPGGFPAGGCRERIPPDHGDGDGDGDGDVGDGDGDGDCDPDPYEPNNTQNASASGVTEADGLTICAGDEDWFALELPAMREGVVRIEFIHAVGDLDLQVLRADGSLVGQSVTVDDVEEVRFSGPAGRYAVRVYGFSGATNRYRLSISTDAVPCGDPYEPNNSLLNATVNFAVPLTGRICGADEDYFLIPPTALETIVVDLQFDDDDGDLDIQLYNPNGQVVASSNTNTDNEHLEFAPFVDGSHILRVFGFAGAENEYTLFIEPLGPPACGNGFLQPPEQCDDGNTLPGDGCSPFCTLEGIQCGNGIPEPGEQCDDGNNLAGDGCSPFCTLETVTCGNGFVEPPFEQCDDGNLIAGDGCSPACTFEVICGNGLVEFPEQCDDGNDFPGDGCSEICLLELPPGWTCDPFWYSDDICDCGCGAFDPFCPGPSAAVCEFDICPGNTGPVDGENWLCSIVGCGDGMLQPPNEQCDDGNTLPGDGCNGNCQLEPRCGDGLVNPGEQCDDGNTVAGDGCSPVCLLEGPPGWICPVGLFGDGICDCGCNALDVDCSSPSAGACAFSHCPPGFGPAPDFNPVCVPQMMPICGNGVFEPPFEECDDGNTLPNDGCSPVCTLDGGPVCGNGFQEPGEQCDDGNNFPGDGCSPSCLFEQMVPPGWSCFPEWYGDGLCDCGCGVLDANDCPSPSSMVCQFDNCPPEAPPLPNQNWLCSLASCGDGMLQPPEQCDDGNSLPGDGCNANCQLEPSCGNGTVEFPEECDDGNNFPGDGCSPGCTVEFAQCGNGVTEPPFEQCDDGNPFPGDGCSPDCQLEGDQCGNGLVDFPFEECDDGNTTGGDGCSADCQIEVPDGWVCPATFYGGDDGCDCGCGALDLDCPGPTADVCDFPNCPFGAMPLPDQNWLCQLPNCGNGSLQPPEECDDGNRDAGDGCNGNCQLEPVCGNGQQEEGEQCDDGNTVSGDGCSASCDVEVPPGWECFELWFGDGICDCGCGAFDVNDCPTQFGDEVCGFDNCDQQGLVIDGSNNGLCTEPFCPDDGLEENDGLMQATPIDLGDLNIAVLCPMDPDFFGFVVGAGVEVRVALEYNSPPGMTLRVERPGVGVIGTSNTNMGVEEVIFFSQTPGPVFARVTGQSVGATVPRPYALTVDVEEQTCEGDEFEPNDSPIAPAAMPPTFEIEATLCQGDVDFYRFDPSGSGEITVHLFGEGDVTATLFDENFTFLGSVQNGEERFFSVGPNSPPITVAVLGSLESSYVLGVASQP